MRDCGPRVYGPKSCIERGLLCQEEEAKASAAVVASDAKHEAARLHIDGAPGERNQVLDPMLHEARTNIFAREEGSKRSFIRGLSTGLEERKECIANGSLWLDADFGSDFV